jgi:hypothetical protein
MPIILAFRKLEAERWRVQGQCPLPKVSKTLSQKQKLQNKLEKKGRRSWKSSLNGRAPA